VKHLIYLEHDRLLSALRAGFRHPRGTFADCDRFV